MNYDKDGDDEPAVFDLACTKSQNLKFYSRNKEHHAND